MVSEFHYKTILLVLLMAMTTLPGLTQDINEPKVVTGVVLADEEPVIGATVRLKGTDIGAATDYDGRFSLKAPVGSTLEIQYIGMDTVEVKVDSKPLVIRMVPPKFWCAWVCNFGYCGTVPEGLFGRVYDSNAHVLPDAIVKVLPSCLSTTTDGKGDFHIQVAEGDTILRVEHPDYEPRQGKIAGNEFVISLDPSSVNKQASIEKLDSLSYAMGDHITRAMLADVNMQTQANHEDYLRGLKNGLNIYKQDTAVVTSYYNGQIMGYFFLWLLEAEQAEEDDQFHLDCMVEGLRKVANNSVILPQDTIGAHHLLDSLASLYQDDDCRFETMLGVLFGLWDADLLVHIHPEMGDTAMIPDLQAYAAGMADMLEISNPTNSYDLGRFVAHMLFSGSLRLMSAMDANVNFDVCVDGACAALSMAERKMSIEEVNQMIISYFPIQPGEDGEDEQVFDNSEVIVEDIPQEVIDEDMKAIEEAERQLQNNPSELP